jgi:hypothetical protein
MAMPYLVTIPEYMAAAATDLANIGSTIRAANAAAAGPTSGLLAAGADEVSAAVTSLFAQHAQAFQALGAQAGTFHQKLVQLLNTAEGMYASAEAAGAAALQNVKPDLAGVIDALPAPLGHPLIGGLGGLKNIDLTGLKNIPRNLFDDIASIPAVEFQALQMETVALSQPNSTGVIYAPVGPNGALVPVGQAGTGSWYMESTGNTWFWNNGNYMQLAAIAQALVPFPAFTTVAANQLQIIAMADLPANDAFDQFEVPNLPALFHGFFKVPLSQLIAGYTFPSSGPTVTADGVPIVWAGQTVQFVPGLAVKSFADSLTATPTGVQHIPVDEVLPTVLAFENDLAVDFNPLATGSYVFWGAPTLYGIPSALAGLVTGHLGIPNPFLLGGAPSGAEPSWGPQADSSYLIPGLEEGFQNLIDAFQGIPGNPGPPV